MTPEQIKASTEGKDAYVLNLSADMTAEIIKNSQEKIAILEASKEAMLPAYEKERLFYEEAKRAFDAVEVQMANLNDGIAKQKHIIDIMSHFRRNKAENKELRVNVPPATRQGTRAPKRVDWLAEAANILAAEGRFMGAEELFTKIVAQPHIKAAISSFKNSLNTIGASTVNSWSTHANRVVSGHSSRGLTPTIFLYKEMFGLVEWAGKDWVPKAEYMKQFMYAAAK